MIVGVLFSSTELLPPIMNLHLILKRIKHAEVRQKSQLLKILVIKKPEKTRYHDSYLPALQAGGLKGGGLWVRLPEFYFCLGMKSQAPSAPVCAVCPPHQAACFCTLILT